MSDGSDDRTPLSYKRYRVVEPFAVMAHSEEQALQRWEFFKRVLEQLAGNQEESHDVVKFVTPERYLDDATPPTFEFVDEYTFDEWPRGGMASGTLPEWAWLTPDYDEGWNPEKLAYRLYFGTLDEELEEALNKPDDKFWF